MGSLEYACKNDDQLSLMVVKLYVLVLFSVKKSSNVLNQYVKNHSVSTYEAIYEKTRINNLKEINIKVTSCF